MFTDSSQYLSFNLNGFFDFFLTNSGFGVKQTAYSIPLSILKILLLKLSSVSKMGDTLLSEDGFGCGMVSFQRLSLLMGEQCHP